MAQDVMVGVAQGAMEWVGIARDATGWTQA